MIVEAKSVIAVSDLHLGHERANPHAFCDFLKWIETLEKNPVTYNLSDGFSKEFTFPEKLILLGDVFELYDPEDGDVNKIAEHMKPVLKQLSEISCEKVYVTGNHDESMTLLHGLEIEKSKIRAYRRHYPRHAGADTVRIGEKEYFFLHGHQFDKKIEQIGEWGTLGPYIVFQLQGLSKSIFKFGGWGSVILAGVLGLLHILCREYYVESNALLYVIAGIAPFWMPKIIWKLFVPLVRKKSKPRDKEIPFLLKERYYKPEKDIISADFIVFGHTHYPGMCEESEVVKILTKKSVPKEWDSKGLLNTGGWFREEETPFNTFLYMDSDYVLLLKWNPQEEKPDLVYGGSYIKLDQNKS